MSRLTILGIDALDPNLLNKWKDDLPNFSRIMDQGYYVPLESTQPPDSIPAWVSIYTGMQPWQHGVGDCVTQHTHPPQDQEIAQQGGGYRT